jgi:hypothetical protein
MHQTGVIKKTFKNKPESRKKVRMSILRWLEDVENDLRGLELKICRQMIENSLSWMRPISLEALTSKKLVSNLMVLAKRDS